MSKYTTELRFICETEAGVETGTNYKEVISKARPKIFDFDYPIFDPAYKSVLETKIIKHFYTREIGAETYGLWKLWLDTKMNEIMPYYNQLYTSELLKFNPFFDVDITTDHNKKNDGKKDDKTNNNGTSETDTTTKTTTDRHEDDSSWRYYSDTPQGGLENITSTLKYLTDLTHETDDNDVHTTVNGTSDTKNKFQNNGTLDSEFHNTEDYLQHVVGKKGTVSYSKLLIEYRNTFLNIDLLIINDLKELFMNLW